MGYKIPWTPSAGMGWAQSEAGQHGATCGACTFQKQQDTQTREETLLSWDPPLPGRDLGPVLESTASQSPARAGDSKAGAEKGEWTAGGPEHSQATQVGGALTGDFEGRGSGEEGLPPLALFLLMAGQVQCSLGLG